MEEKNLAAMEQQLTLMGEKALRAARSLALLSADEKVKVLNSMADAVEAATPEVLAANAVDMDNARKNTERRIGSERAAKLRLAPIPADIDGGLILRYGNTETNCSISALLEEMRRGLESRISAILFK